MLWQVFHCSTAQVQGLQLQRIGAIRSNVNSELDDSVIIAMDAMQQRSDGCDRMPDMKHAWTYRGRCRGQDVHLP
jgi:hypothetical protein